MLHDVQGRSQATTIGRWLPDILKNKANDSLGVANDS